VDVSKQKRRMSETVDVDWDPPGMATATKIDLSPVTDSGIYSSNVREDTARTASDIRHSSLWDLA
jgi:hypothetical protein